MKILLFLLVLVGSVLWIPDAVQAQSNPFFPPDADQDLDTCQMVQARGFACETVQITVGQGYKILLHHLPPVLLSPTAGKKPVILQPGLTGSSSNFVIASKTVNPDPTVMGQNMGIELAKRGYDVWISNNRGNIYGLEHATLTPNNPAFWDWTWDQISQYDTPVIIDWVRSRTGANKVHFVGHSQGSAVMFALLSRDNSFNTKVASFTGINPVTYIRGAKTTFRGFVAFISPGLQLVGGKVGVFTKNFISDTLTPLACSYFPINVGCAAVWWSLVGPNTNDLDLSRLPVYMAHQPTSTSGKNLLQYNQMFNDGSPSDPVGYFRRYDYGLAGNLINYGQATPPKYDLTNITHPSVHVIYTQNDWYVPVDGVEKMKTELVNAEYIELPDPLASHIDPLYGITNAVVTNNLVLGILNANN